MKKRMKFRIGVDAGMTLLLLFLMGYPLWEEERHEWAGAAMFVLFILHHLLNRSWYTHMFSGRVTAFRVLQLIVDALLFLDMLALMISGIWLSQHVFAFLPIHGGISWARILHMVSAYWGFVLMSCHLGMHWHMFIGIFRKLLAPRGVFMRAKAALRVISIGASAYGLYAFIQRDLMMYLTAGTQFVFFDYSESALKFYLDHLAIMALWMMIFHEIGKWCRKAHDGRSIGGRRNMR